MMASTIFCNECGASNPLQETYCFACNEPLHPPTPSPHLQNQANSLRAAVPSSGSIGPLAPAYLLHERYTIVRQVGTGGFGAVYQAKDTLFSHRLVAIKEMSQDGLSPRELAEATAAFEREALFLADLTHPNLPRIHDHFSENGRIYVVMDFIAGDTLEDYLSKFGQRFSVETALDIGLQLSTVLDYLHTRQPPIIFRDLKPANIMRTIDNHVYLIDFGIARHFKPGKAKDTIPLGSRGYAAPEQYGKGQSTPQSDIYGLGATLHQLLTSNDPSLSLFHFDPVHIYNSPIATRLDALLKRMVEMEASKRPASMTIVKQELEELIAQQTAQRLSPAQLSSRGMVRRRRFLWGVVSVAGVCSSSSAITALVSAKLSDSGTAIHPLIGSTPDISASPMASFPSGATVLSKPLYTYLGHSGVVTAVVWSSQGQIASSDAVGNAVQVWDADTGEVIFSGSVEFGVGGEKPSGDNQRVDGLAWSRDGRYVVSALADDRVEIWDVNKGIEILSLRFSQSGNTNAVTWSPDGTRIAAVSGNTAIEVRSATTGNLFFTYGGHTQFVLTIAWSPDGKQIASGGADGVVQVWDAKAGYAHATYRGHSAEVKALAWSPDSQHIASGGGDGTVQVWEAATAQTLFIYRGHAGGVNAVTWAQKGALHSGESTRIASGGTDATVQVWSLGKARNTQPGQAMTLEDKVLVYRGHTESVTAVAWAPDGQDRQRIASGSEDGTVQIWRAT